jgi:hypothetical protein
MANVATITRDLGGEGIRVETRGNLTVEFSTTNWKVSGNTTVVGSDTVTGYLLLSSSYQIVGQNATFLLSIPIIPISPYVLSSDISLVLQGPSIVASVQVTRNVDINGDGVVNILDERIFAMSYGCRVGMSCYNPRADFNADGVVNLTDLSIFARYFNVASIGPTIFVGGGGGGERHVLL